MRTLLRSTALVALAAVAPAAFAGSGDHWYEDFDTAAKVARKESKNLLVDFTGSDWCGWCIRLDKEVFDHDEFVTKAQEDYVLVKLDFPRGADAKKAVPNPQRNNELNDKYKIEGYPTILLVTPDGDLFGRTGYQAGGPQKYLAHLEQLRSRGLPALKRALDLIERFEAADDAAKEGMLEDVLAALEGMERDQPGSEGLAKASKLALAVDADGSRGLKQRAVAAILSVGQADAEVFSAARALDPRNDEGLLEQAVQAQMMTVQKLDDVKAVVADIDSLDSTGPIKDERRAFWIYGNAAVWNGELLKKADRGRYYANKALAVGSGDKRFMERLRTLADA